MRRPVTRTLAVLAATWLLAGAAAHAQQAAYRCVSHGRVTYTAVPCPGGRQVGVHPVHETDKWKKPPQDRAKIARRATLSEDDRRECTALDAQLVEQQAMLKAKGDAATLQDEMPLVRSKKRYRELHC